MSKIARLIFYYLLYFPIYKIRFGKIGKGTRLIQPKIDGHKRISIGNKVYINNGGWLACVPLTGNDDAALSIGDGTYIGRYCHIYATQKIAIGAKVLIADKVYIADNLHGHEDINLPILDQPIKQTAPVTIGDGAWLGENVCIIGASVGKNAVVGANAVVTKDVPDYTVVVGTPAYPIKKFDTQTNQWRKTDKEGNFI